VFCSLAIVFSLIHPSILLFAFMPLYMYGFFKSHSQYKSLAKFFVFLFGVYLVIYYTYNLVILIVSINQNVEQFVTYMEKLFGYERTTDIYETLFPGECDYLIYILLSLNAYYISKQEDIGFFIGRGRMDDEQITNFDELTEVRSRFSYAFRGTDRAPIRPPTQEHPDVAVIQEERKEDDADKMSIVSGT
jgi:hypothetical protein